MNPAGVDRMDIDEIFSLVPDRFGGTLSWYASPKSDEFHTDGLHVKEAQWVLERCAKEKDRPFFMVVGFFRPHTPYVAPADPYYGYYPEADMPLYPPIDQNPPEVPKAALMSYMKAQDMLTDELRRKCVQAYYASISFMDAQVGKIVHRLDDLGMAEDTIIVFASDHGYHMGEHGLWQKNSLFEESARVPLMIVAPGVTKGGTVIRSPVSLVDLYPALTELAGVSTPSNLQGQSLVPKMKDVSLPGRGWALTQVVRMQRTNPKAKSAKEKAKGEGKRATSKASSPPKPRRFFGYSIRTERWRYTEWDDGAEGRELYDHQNDAKELSNLADRSEHATTVAEMENLLAEAVKESFPPDGITPTVSKDAPWTPNLFDPAWEGPR